MASGVLLNAVSYDPGTLATGSVTGLSGMAAMDVTNLRNTFTAPGSGTVQVRGGFTVAATTTAPTWPGLLLGVLEGATVKLRMAPIGGLVNNSNHVGDAVGLEFFGFVTGLGAGSHNFDLAYSVDVVGANTQAEWGGPNDTSGPDAGGAAWLEVWDPGSALLGAVCYDPGTAASKSMTSLLALTKLDAGSNLSITFTSPGTTTWFFYRIRVVYTGASSTFGSAILGLLESGTPVPGTRVTPKRSAPAAVLAGTKTVLDASGVFTGLSAGSHTLDAAYGVQLASSASGALKCGGPDDSTPNNAWGAALFEIWQASS